MAFDFLGVGKLLSNFIGGGSGSSTNQSSIQAQNATTTQSSDSTIQQSQTQSTAGKQATQGLSSTAQAVGSEQSTRNFSDGFLALLEEQTALGLSQAGVGSAAAADRIGQISAQPNDFDGRRYVNDVMTAANNSISGDQAANRNKIMNATGGSTTGNSQAALLDNRMRTDSAAQLAGIRGEATARAAEIARNDSQSRSGEIAGLAGSIDNGLSSLIQALKGGEVAFVGQEQTALENSSKQIQETTQDQTTNMYQQGTSSSMSNTSSTANIDGTTRTPFNWTKAVGSIFDNIGT